MITADSAARTGVFTNLVKTQAIYEALGGDQWVSLPGLGAVKEVTVGALGRRSRVGAVLLETICHQFGPADAKSRT